MCSDINQFHFLQAKDVNLFYEEFTAICAVSLRLHDTPYVTKILIDNGCLTRVDIRENINKLGPSSAHNSN